MPAPHPRPPLIAAIEARDLAQVRALLDAGADPNSGVPYREGDAAPVNIPALYFACVANAPDIVELLLQRGALTQDCESIYHAAQLNHRRCLEILLEHGADLSSSQLPCGNTPLYFLAGHHDEQEGRAPWLEGMRWLLAHGADPNVTSTERQNTPLHALAAAFPEKLLTARVLLDAGADPNLARADGRAAYALARRSGNDAIAALLLERGARATPLDPLDAFLAACLAADESTARALLAAHPGLVAAMPAELRCGELVDAVCRARAGAVQLMVRLGFDPGEQHDSGSALHFAAWHGQPAMVALLLALGAPLHQRDAQFGGSPLGWAAHGSGCHAGRDPAYCTVIDLLIAAGAGYAEASNRWGEKPEAMASSAVAEHLRRRFDQPLLTT